MANSSSIDSFKTEIPKQNEWYALMIEVIERFYYHILHLPLMIVCTSHVVSQDFILEMYGYQNEFDLLECYLGKYVGDFS